MKQLKSKGADVSKSDSEGYTPLHCAQNAQVATWLAEQGVAVAPTAQHLNETPLHLAVGVNRADVIKVLLDKDATQVDVRNGLGYSALMKSIMADDAAHAKNYAAARVLLDHNASIDIVDDQSASVLFCFAEVQCADGFALLRNVLDRARHSGLNLVNRKDNDGLVPLHDALSAKNPDWNPELVRILLEYGADPNIVDEGFSPIAAAIHELVVHEGLQTPEKRQSFILKARMLLGAGANPTIGLNLLLDDIKLNKAWLYSLLDELQIPRAQQPNHTIQEPQIIDLDDLPDDVTIKQQDHPSTSQAQDEAQPRERRRKKSNKLNLWDYERVAKFIDGLDARFEQLGYGNKFKQHEISGRNLLQLVEKMTSNEACDRLQYIGVVPAGHHLTILDAIKDLIYE